MKFFSGIKYNLLGLRLAVKTPRLLFWGLVRFFITVIIAVLCAGVILAYHQELLGLIWSKPDSQWVLWLWHLLSWLISAILVGISILLSYVASQILFSVLIMDLMSRMTEKMVTGGIREPAKMPKWQLFLFLIKQEIPRAIVPVLLSLLLIGLGWMTPLGPIVTLLSSALAAVFLAWDNTDLVPARQMTPFGARFRLFMRTLPFHLGFGILFLIPIVNLLFLSFAPVGATLYQIDRNRDTLSSRGKETPPGRQLNARL